VRARRGVLLAIAVMLQVVSVLWAADKPGGAGRVFRTAQPPASAQRGDIWISPKDGAEMVYVPAGEFIMGSSDEQIRAIADRSPDVSANRFADQKPARSVSLDGFWIYKHEVTVAEYQQFCKQTGRTTPDPPIWGWKDDHPIVRVAWSEAAAYAAWAGLSLPTEAQWEKAARGGDGRCYPWGNEWDVKRAVIGSPTTQSVGSRQLGASPYGCLDMAGNACEWCLDWYREDYYADAPGVNPKGPQTGDWSFVLGKDSTVSYTVADKVARGGSFQRSAPHDVRCDRRYGRGVYARPDGAALDPAASRGRYDDVGFRCATAAGESKDELAFRFLQAAYDGDTKEVARLLGEGVALDARDKHELSAPMFASWQGHADVLRLLLARGADIRSGDERGRTPVLYAATRGHIGIVTILVENGADVNARDKDGMTALLCAKSRKQKDVVAYLLAHGARDEDLPVPATIPAIVFPTD